ncbi:MAG: TOBE domain-containing protein, partial [Planctomycetota bacterium]
PGPDVLLMDEPFSSLDARLREVLRADVRAILQSLGMTGLMVTHDRDEALSVADRVSVMLGGVVVQTGTPEKVYTRPASPEVASFLGFRVLLDGEASAGVVESAVGPLETDPNLEGPVTFLIRPEQVVLGEGDREAVVAERQYFGHDAMVTLADGDLRLDARVGPVPDLRPGDRVRYGVSGPVLAWLKSTR